MEVELKRLRNGTKNGKNEASTTDGSQRTRAAKTTELLTARAEHESASVCGSQQSSCPSYRSETKVGVSINLYGCKLFHHRLLHTNKMEKQSPQADNDKIPKSSKH